MKKTLTALVVLLVLLTSGVSWAADWTLSPSLVSRAGKYVYWKVLCTSNGGALVATDLVALMSPSMKSVVQGATHMALKVSPGTAGVAPDNTIDVGLYDAQGASIFSHAAYTHLADTTGISLAEDYGQSFPTVYGALYLALNDIGTLGDQVTLYFEAWKE